MSKLRAFIKNLLVNIAVNIGDVCHNNNVGPVWAPPSPVTQVWEHAMYNVGGTCNCHFTSKIASYFTMQNVCFPVKIKSNSSECGFQWNIWTTRPLWQYTRNSKLHHVSTTVLTYKRLSSETHTNWSITTSELHFILQSSASVVYGVAEHSGLVWYQSTAHSCRVHNLRRKWYK